MMLTRDQIEFYTEHGYVRVPQVFTPEEIEELSDELDRLVHDWAKTDMGWTGPWRKEYMNEETEKKSKLTAMHDLQFYSAAWMRSVTGCKLAEAMTDLLGPNVELHHSTLHIKPPESGHPFPMHQDSPFYEHENGAFVDVLVHLDDTNAANGEIRFLDGSHKRGKLEHITQTADGPCSPHLPTDRYRLEDTVPVPAKRGDIVCFSIYTVHGSYLNTTDKPRRLVRVGYRDPQNRQLAGQSCDRPGPIVAGYRERREGEALLRID
jgi:phytanoyl-CoA hydroxylase